MLDESKLILNSTDKVLLLAIYKELIKLNSNVEALKEGIKFSNENILASRGNIVGEDYSKLKRVDLLKLAKDLKNKPKNLSNLSNEKLIELLKG